MGYVRAASNSFYGSRKWLFAREDVSVLGLSSESFFGRFRLFRKIDESRIVFRCERIRTCIVHSRLFQLKSPFWKLITQFTFNFSRVDTYNGLFLPHDCLLCLKIIKRSSQAFLDITNVKNSWIQILKGKNENDRMWVGKMYSSKYLLYVFVVCVVLKNNAFLF